MERKDEGKQANRGASGPVVKVFDYSPLNHKLVGLSPTKDDLTGHVTSDALTIATMLKTNGPISVKVMWSVYLFTSG